MRKRIFAVFMTLCMIAGGLGIFKNFEVPSALAADEFLYEEDTWGFSADTLIDGDTPYLTTALRQKLLSGKSDAGTQRIQSALAAVQTDISYGFAVLELLHYAGCWNVSDISNTATVLHDADAPVRKDVLTGWINYYNLLQYTDEIAALDEAALSESDSSAALLNAENAGNTAASGGGLALIRLYESASASPSTSLIYGCESGSWSYSSGRYNRRILLADPDNTTFSDSSCLYYNTSSGKWAIPDMSMSSESGAVLGAVIDDVQLLDMYVYSPEKLPRMMTERVFASPGEYDVPITLMQSGIPESLGISLDVDLSPAAEAVLSLSYETDSFDMGTALPAMFCSAHVNDVSLICTAVVNASVSGGIKCEDNTPIISFLMDAADIETVTAAAQKYSIPLQTDAEHGDYYAFPLYFNTNGMNSYYSNVYEQNEFPIVMEGEICIVVQPKETTTTTTTTTAATTTTMTTTASSSVKTTTTTTVTSTASSSVTTTASTTSAQTTKTSPTAQSTSVSTASTSTTTVKSTVSTTKVTTSAEVQTTTESTTSLTTLITTSTTVKTTVTTTATTTKLSFDWGKDNWNLSHGELISKYISSGYGLLDAHEENLNASLNVMERERIRSIAESDWLGAEYGMAVTEILAKSGIFSVSMWDPSVDSVYELDLDNERNLSLVSYYQLLQESDAVQQEIAWTSTYMSKKSALSQLITSASKSSKGGDMTLVCFFGNDYAHAAIAYGVEYGAWYLGSEAYDGRVLIADPYLDSFSDDACVYFKSSTLEWSVPKWGIASTDEDCLIGLASNSISMMNDAGYFMGSSSYINSHEYIPILEVPADSGEFLLSPLGNAGSGAKESSELKWFSTVASMVTNRRAGLDYLAEGFEIYPLSSDTVSYQMSYEECLLSVRADKAESITMLPDTSVSLAGNGSTFEISLTSESLLPWDKVSLCGTGGNNISARHQGDGILVQGDCLDTLMITAYSYSSSSSAIRKMRVLETGKVYKTAFIYAEKDGSIGVLIDEDGDGECETVLGNEQQSIGNLRYGDVNLDDSVSMIDVVKLNLYIANCIMLNKEALLNADCDENRYINSTDSTLLLKYLVNDVPALPLSRALELMGEEQ